MTSDYRLDTDWTRCDGHGICSALSAGAITEDAWGFPVLPGTPAAAERPQPALPVMRRLTSMCPSLALRIVTSSSKEKPMSVTGSTNGGAA